MKDVDVIVVTYKGKEIISDCLEAVLHQDDADYQCILIDNNSADQIGEYVRGKFPSVQIHRCAENLGWVGGINTGITLGHAQYLLLLNDDIVLASKDWIAKLVQAFEADPTLGAATGKIVFYDQPNRIQGVGNTLTRSGNSVCLGLYQDSAEPRYHQASDVLYVCGGAMFVRRSALEEIGGIDTVFPYDDADLGWRLNLAGYRVRYVSGITAVHRSSYTTTGTFSQQQAFWWTVGRAVMLIKNYELKNLLKYFPWNMAKSALEFIKLPPQRRQILRAWYWICSHLPELIAKRRKVQALRKVSDRKLMRLFAHSILQERKVL